MTQIKSGAGSNTIYRWWRRSNRLPMGRWLFSRALGAVAPYSGTIGALVEEVRPGYARVTLRERRRVRNHLSSIHAIALVNLGEIATGLAVLSSISADMRGIVLGIEAEYLKKARGKLVAEAEFELPEIAADSTPCRVEAALKDESGETVTLVRATWLIGYQAP